MSPGSRGRRPGTGSARAQILDAARTVFAERGYSGTTLRAIARAAGVDASLVHHFFGPKEDVFVAAIGRAPSLDIPTAAATGGAPAGVAPDRVSAVGVAVGAGEPILRACLDQWEAPEHRDPVLAVVRSTVSHAEAAARLRHFVAVELHGTLARTHPGPDPATRATLVGAQLIGLMVARHVVPMEPLASADRDTLVGLLAPALGRCLNTPLVR